MFGSDGSGDVSKRISPEDRRETEKPNGVVLWSVKTKSDDGSAKKLFSDKFLPSSSDKKRRRGEWFPAREMTVSGISHLC